MATVYDAVMDNLLATLERLGALYGSRSGEEAGNGGSEGAADASVMGFFDSPRSSSITSSSGALATAAAVGAPAPPSLVVS
jgi:hypothetical protein